MCSPIGSRYPAIVLLAGALLAGGGTDNDSPADLDRLRPPGPDGADM